ncbi:NADPH--cytochrome P450 reductase [Colletotrichum fructicola]|uniref:NADPH--cytochrome P450 reductase n=1 Tax=Colletotrichum fructicola (strain Nara gc5) TaxID=1213859 RepID=L2FYJ2_COLFN|nr:NADPH--cytochrome P450 reductase [Colletotrichum fructicola]KAE9583614.1 NADPH--cytochrome P450 reductase [Colletotrichum fructicola]KAF4427696.1 NADPH-cytochrome P450 reductase [Colletotrichum fructicola]KAF4485977.1 NADPH--cytochrome P450 reductase [Colletotrichum fructicola Nara gc5]KAF4885897.1 NADPH--cytochrome P450 reductase [Colletotrichum fructicola]
MATSFTYNNTQSQILMDAVDTLSKQASYDDYLLLPLVILGSLFVFNRGSIIPKTDPYHQKWFWKPQKAMGGNVTLTNRTRNIAEKFQELGSDLVIFWGSQSGTAEGFAHRLAREFHQRFKLNALVADLSDYDAETIALIPESKLCIFIMSTYGEGDPSDNAQDFVSWSSRTTGVSLEHLKYAAFGCGNSNYRFYNKVIDDVVTALTSFRATAILPTGKGNEATRTTEEDFMDWKESLFKTLVNDFAYKEYDVEYEPSVDVIVDEVVESKLHVGKPFYRATSKKATTLNSEIAALPVRAKRELARHDGQGHSVIDLEVDLSSHLEIKYKTGDHIAIWPVNPTEEVQSLTQILGLDSRRNESIQVISKATEEEPKVPSPTTIQALCQHYLEICAAVPRETVLSLVQYASTDKVKTELKMIGHDRETYAAFLEQNHLTLARLLKHTLTVDPSATWTNLPLSFMIDFLPAMQPRLYSISSSRITSPRHVSLTVSVKPSQLAAKPDVTIAGLASTYLSRLQPDRPGSPETALINMSQVHAQIRGSSFKLPILPSVPLVMVAAGTGIAPFRAFVQERARLASVGKEIGRMVLFFGCQNESDYLYKDELSELMEGALAGKLEVVTAFSRADGQKTYVQHRLQERSKDLGRLLLDEDAAFYICGAANMAKAVGNVVRETVKVTREWEDDEVESWRQERKRSKRWFEDVWS